MANEKEITRVVNRLRSEKNLDTTAAPNKTHGAQPSLPALRPGIAGHNPASAGNSASEVKPVDNDPLLPASTSQAQNVVPEPEQQISEQQAEPLASTHPPQPDVPSFEQSLRSIQQHQLQLPSQAQAEAQPTQSGTETSADPIAQPVPLPTSHSAPTSSLTTHEVNPVVPAQSASPVKNTDTGSITNSGNDSKTEQSQLSLPSSGQLEDQGASAS